MSSLPVLDSYMSTSAAMSRAMPSESRRVTWLQWRSMKVKATTLSSSTIGAMMMMRARA